MEQWSADFTNDFFNDYNLIVEVLCNNEEIAVIRQGEKGMEIKWYPNKEELNIPFNWLLNLLIEAEKRLQSNF